MNIVIVDFSVSAIIFFSLYELLKKNNLEKKIIYGFLILGCGVITSSLFLNLNYVLLSLSSYIVCLLLLSMYLMAFVEFVQNIRLFWLFFSIFGVVIYSLILCKKLMYNNLKIPIPQGPKGPQGIQGIQGKSYLLETYPEKCYHKLETQIENLLRQIKEVNKIHYDTNEIQFKNEFLKMKLKKICLSQNFRDLLHKNNSTENNYRKLTKMLSKTISKWIFSIMKNSKEEEDEIKIKLGYHLHDNISGILDKNSLMNFTNTHGFEFLEDYFYTPHYFNDLNMDNPFNNIEKTEIWNWGSVNAMKCQ